MTALPDLSGVPHPRTWPLYPHRWFGRFVIRRRFGVTEHGVEHVPGVGFARVQDVALPMDDALRPSGRSRAVQPERRFVAARIDGRQVKGFRRGDVVQSDDRCRAADPVRAGGYHAK